MASIIKTDNIQKVSDDSNIIKKCGSTITIGSCGASVALASGATQSGFGRTGTVDWCTTAKTSPFTAASGDGYFVNTTSGAVTVTLPASPSAGDIVAIKDYAKTFDTNNVTVGRNSSKIGGLCTDATLSTEGLSATLVYVDGTQGWLVVNDGLQSQAPTAAYITATGGTVTTCGDYKIHTFTASGCFAVTSAGNPCGSNAVSYVVVAGGGGTGGWAAGGAGAGGFREGKCTSDPYTASPLDAGAGLPVSVQTYPITVGSGGTGAPYPTRNTGTKGSNSVFSTITSAGGGVGAPNDAFPGHDCGATAGNGGSGGGSTASPTTVGSGNTPPVSPPQGNDGGTGHVNSPIGGYFGGGGGGAGAAGSNDPGTNNAGPGGDGVTSSITGSPVARAGGGGGGQVTTGSSTGGSGGGGAGGNGGGTNPGTSGTTNTGGGGGGAGATNPTGTTAGAGGSGGSGLVIIRYKFQ